MAVAIVAACATFQSADTQAGADGGGDAGADTDGGAGDDGGSAPDAACAVLSKAQETIVEDAGMVLQLVGDESEMFWVSNDLGGTLASDGLWSCSLPDCKNAKLHAQDTVRSLAMDATHVYVIVASPPSILRYERKSAAITDTWFMTDSVGNAPPIAVDGNNVYAFVGSTTLRLEAIAKDTAKTAFSIPNAAPDAGTPRLNGAHNLAVTADTLYFTSDTDLVACSLPGCTALESLTSLCAGHGVAVDDGKVWAGAQCGNPAILACARPRCTGGPEKYAEPANATPIALTISGDDVYWIDSVHGDIVTCKRATCGMSRTIIGHSPTPTSVLPTACAVFWGDKSGTIYRVGR